MTRYWFARIFPAVMMVALPLLLSLHRPHGFLQSSLYVASYFGAAALSYALWKYWGKLRGPQDGGAEGTAAPDDPVS